MSILLPPKPLSYSPLAQLDSISTMGPVTNLQSQKTKKQKIMSRGLDWFIKFILSVTHYANKALTWPGYNIQKNLYFCNLICCIHHVRITWLYDSLLKRQGVRPRASCTCKVLGCASAYSINGLPFSRGRNCQPAHRHWTLHNNYMHTWNPRLFHYI